jgi:hypothetical protein
MMKCLFFFNRQPRLYPGIPATFEGRCIRKTHFRELLCHPGTCRIVGSGAIQDDVAVLLIFIGPGRNIEGVLTNRTLYLQVTFFPAQPVADVNDNKVRINQLTVQGIDRDFF